MKRSIVYVLGVYIVLTLVACSGQNNDLHSQVQMEGMDKTENVVIDNGEKTEEIVKPPSKEEVLSMREKVLAGMTDEEKKRLTTNIKDLNCEWENLYFYSDIFHKLEDKESLYWNYIDASGEIVVMNIQNDDGTVTEITDYNRFNWESFIALIQDMQKSIQNEALNAELDRLTEEMRSAHETHDVQHVINLFHILHDMDYFLLRYGVDDVGPYVDDISFMTIYYDSLTLYDGEEEEEIYDGVEVGETEKEEIVYQTDFTLQQDNVGTIKLLGTIIDTNYIGIKTIEIQMNAGETLYIPVKEALYDSREVKQYCDYGKSTKEDCGLRLEDINFDGYTDIGLEVDVYAWGYIYGYWIYQPDKKQYAFYNRFHDSISVNLDEKFCTVYRRDAKFTFIDYYQLNGEAELVLVKTEIEPVFSDGTVENETIYYE